MVQIKDVIRVHGGDPSYNVPVLEGGGVETHKYEPSRIETEFWNISVESADVNDFFHISSRALRFTLRPELLEDISSENLHQKLISAFDELATQIKNDKEPNDRAGIIILNESIFNP